MGYKGIGKGYKGTGQGFKGGGWKGGYRSPGKAVGKGFDYYGNEDHAEVSGEELYNSEYNQNGEDWNCDFYNNVYIVNVMVMLEKGNRYTKEREFDKREVLTGRAMANFVKFQNRFGAFGGDDDDDNETEDNDVEGDEWKTVKQSKKMNLN